MSQHSFPSRAVLRAQQAAELGKLIATIFPRNRFYAGQMVAAGIEPRTLEFEHFKQLPFTTKTELVPDQEQHPLFGTNLTFPLTEYSRFHQTSGTTGTPLRCLDTPESWNWMVERWLEI